MNSQTDGTALTPTVVEQDGWEVHSSSSGLKQSAAEIAAAITEPPDDTPADEPEDAPADAVASPEPDAADDAPAPDAKPRKRLTAKERQAELRAEINALTRQKHDAQRALEQTRATARPADAPAPKPAATAAPTPAATFPDKPTWAQYEAEGKGWDEFQDARDAWNDARIEQVKAEAKADAKAETERFLQDREARDQRTAADRTHREKLDRAKATHADFDQVVQANLADVPRTLFLEDLVRNHPAGADVLYALAQHPDAATALADLTSNATHAMMDAVMAMDDPTPLLLHLAEHPDEFARLAQTPRAPALVALGKLTARLEGANTGSPTKSSPPVTSAPTPIRPIAGTRTTGASKSPEDLPFGPEYVEAMNKRERETSARRW